MVGGAAEGDIDLFGRFVGGLLSESPALSPPEEWLVYDRSSLQGEPNIVLSLSATSSSEDNKDPATEGAYRSGTRRARDGRPALSAAASASAVSKVIPSSRPAFGISDVSSRCRTFGTSIESSTRNPSSKSYPFSSGSE